MLGLPSFQKDVTWQSPSYRQHETLYKKKGRIDKETTLDNILKWELLYIDLISSFQEEERIGTILYGSSKNPWSQNNSQTLVSEHRRSQTPAQGIKLLFILQLR